MEKGIPILSCTDKNTDIGDIIENNNFGWKCYSDDVENFIKTIKIIIKLHEKELKKNDSNSYDFLKANYTSYKSYQIIKKQVEKGRTHENINNC